MIIPLIPNHLIFTTWDTSIVVAPSKRNILTQTRVDIGSTQLRSSYETIMLQLSIIFFPPVRSEPTFGENLPENEHSRVRTVRVEKILYITGTLLFHMKISAEQTQYRPSFVSRCYVLTVVRRYWCPVW